MPRRTIPQGPGQRVPVMTRTTQELRDQLEKAASTSGRSLAQEVELRLERSFDPVDSFARLVGGLAQVAEAITGRPWRTDPETLDILQGLVFQQFEALRVDPTGAHLAHEARRAHRMWLENAWRNPSPKPWVSAGREADVHPNADES
jgi:hypothetical protein